MKITCLFLTLAVTCRAYSVPDIDIENEWQIFKTKFKKIYETTIEANHRFITFKENLARIEAHNVLYNIKHSHRLGITQFTDWSVEEFTKYLNKFKFNGRDSRKISTFFTNFTVPDTIDWRLQGAVSEVKNQGHCGSCWSFAATGALEGQAKLELGKRISLSEQNLLDCANEEYGNHGCNGGNINTAFIYVKENGIEAELDYPYVAKQGECRQKSAEIYVSDFEYVITNEEELKKAVGSVGPISVAIEATSELQNYAGGVIFDRTCTDHLNHGVLVVGYGVEDNQEYWLIKNSWGPSWGEQGYFKLARNKYNNCGISLMASYPIVEQRKKD